jgi:putative tricarboxylic transport membrane protein
MIKQSLAAMMAMACLWSARIGYAASDDNFYRGKTIRLIVAFSAGGGYDAYSRTIGRHLGKHIPGNPTVVVENMTGAGGIIHANFMYQAKPDGLIIGNNAGGLILQQIMGAKGIEFDGKKFEFLGAPGSDHHVCTLSKASGITSMEKWFASKDPIKFGGVGPGGGASDNPRVLQAALGLPIKVIDGYKGTADIRLAAESGELAWHASPGSRLKPPGEKGSNPEISASSCNSCRRSMRSCPMCRWLTIM